MSVLKARLAPHLHLRVPFESGKYGSRWSNKGVSCPSRHATQLMTVLDLDPVPPEQRTWGAVDYWAYVRAHIPWECEMDTDFGW
jgi:hypothetical protein